MSIILKKPVKLKKYFTFYYTQNFVCIDYSELFTKTFMFNKFSKLYPDTKRNFNERIILFTNFQFKSEFSSYLNFPVEEITFNYFREPVLFQALTYHVNGWLNNGRRSWFEFPNDWFQIRVSAISKTRQGWPERRDELDSYDELLSSVYTILTKA